MNKTVQEYAKERGVTPQAVYNAIKRNNVSTIQGVSNGKSAQFLDDEAQAILDQGMKPTQKSNEIAVASIQLEIANREIALLREKELEVEETRMHMLARVEELGSDLDVRLTELTNELNMERAELKASYTKELSECQRKIDILKDSNADLKQELHIAKMRIAELENTLEKAVERFDAYVEKPFKAYMELRRLNKNGKSTENN